MTANFWLKTGDRKPSITATLTDATGAPVDITGAEITFVMRLIDNDEPVVVGFADNLQQNEFTVGNVIYHWAEGDTDVAGGYVAEWQAFFADDTLGTFPNDGDTLIAILERVDEGTS